DPAGGFLSVLGFAQVADRHVGAFTRKGDRHRSAAPAVAAGDQCAIAFQASAAAIPLLAVVRARLQFVCATGNVDFLLLLKGRPSKCGSWVDAVGRSHRELPAICKKENAASRATAGEELAQQTPYRQLRRQRLDEASGG